MQLPEEKIITFNLEEKHNKSVAFKYAKHFIYILMKLNFREINE